jgi:hypothetical protein
MAPQHRLTPPRHDQAIHRRSITRLKMLDDESIPPESAQPSPPDPEDVLPMLDVDPPHQAIHGWRDFFIHLGTITIGFLIALSLEAGVEALHHRHIVNEAREQIREEIQANQKIVAGDRKDLDATAKILRKDLVVLARLKSHSGPVNPSDFKLNHWAWNGPLAAAWQTARDSGALALMPYDDAHDLSLVYGQQALVSDQVTLYANHYHAAAIPLDINPDITALSPAEIDELAHGVATTLADIQYLELLTRGLDANYSSVLREFYPQ